MALTLRTLILEDQPSDAELMVHHLRRAGYEVDWRRVSNEAEYLAGLETAPDLILADYSLPQFDALRALHLLQERGVNVPFIVVTGSMEEVAIECMKQGAADYLLKDRLGRLGQAVERALEQKRLRDEKRQAERALQENQRAMSTLLSNLPGMAYRCLNDPQWTMQFVSDGCRELTGYQPADMVANASVSYREIIHPADRDSVWHQVQAALKDQRSFQLVYRIRTAGGEEKWVWEQGRGVYSPEGELQALEGFVTDITARFRTEEALRNSEELFRQLAESVHEVFWVLDATTKNLIYVSPLFEEITGWERTTVFANPESFLDLVDPDDRPLIERKIRQDGILADVEFRIRRRDGAVRWVNVRAYPILDTEQRVYRIAGVAEDITEHKEAEAQLRQSSLRFQALDSVSKALAEANPDYRAVLQVVSQQIANLIGDCCTIHLISNDGRWVDAVASHYADRSLASLRLPLIRQPVEQSLGWGVIQSGQSLLVADVHAADVGAMAQAVHADTQSLLMAPLRTPGRILGFISLERTAANPPYTAEDQVFVQELADRAALAIANARLYDESRRRLDHIQALHEIDMAIAGNVDLRTILEIILDKALSQLGVSAADILVYQPATQMLEFAAGRGFYTHKVHATHLRMGQGYAGRAALERQVIHLLDFSELPPTEEFSILLSAEHFTTYHAIPLLTKGQIKGVFEVFHRSPFTPDQEWLDLLEAVAGQAAIALDIICLFDDLQRKNLELSLAYDDTIEGWSRALDLRDRETEGHTQRVMELTLRLAQLVGFNDDELIHIRRGALLHDIGKMGVPDHILLKPGPLTDDEWVIMRQHPQFAFDMLSPIAYLQLALDIPYCHHEWWDGNGYPRGLKGEQIPLAARLFAIVDVWDAITSDRPYRNAWPIPQALEHLRHLAGKQFDPVLFQKVLPVIEKQALAAQGAAVPISR